MTVRAVMLHSQSLVLQPEYIGLDEPVRISFTYRLPFDEHPGSTERNARIRFN